jgi:hypothetical protein
MVSLAAERARMGAIILALANRPRRGHCRLGGATRLSIGAVLGQSFGIRNYGFGVMYARPGEIDSCGKRSQNGKNNNG